MIYADSSFLFSLYAWDDNTAAASRVYRADGRRPLLFTPWQRLELRNAVRLVVHRLKAAGQPIRFQAGNVFRRIEADLDGGCLRHADTEDRAVFRLAETLSAAHTEALGCAAVDLWHVAAAIALEADTFWTFDQDQHSLASATGRFRRVPKLTP